MNNTVTMTPDQMKAQELYLASVTYENNFKPMSMEMLAKVLKDEHEIQTSSSALGRWRSKFRWAELVEVQIATATIENKETREMIEQSAMGEGSQKIFDDFKANESIKNGAYHIAQKQLKHYEKIIDKDGGYLSEKDIKIVIELLKLTSDREDKLLDRQAILLASRQLNPEDVIKALMSNDDNDFLEAEYE